MLIDTPPPVRQAISLPESDASQSSPELYISNNIEFDTAFTPVRQVSFESDSLNSPVKQDSNILNSPKDGNFRAVVIREKRKEGIEIIHRPPKAPVKKDMREVIEKIGRFPWLRRRPGTSSTRLSHSRRRILGRKSSIPLPRLGTILTLTFPEPKSFLTIRSPKLVQKLIQSLLTQILLLTILLNRIQVLSRRIPKTIISLTIILLNRKLPIFQVRKMKFPVKLTKVLLFLRKIQTLGTNQSNVVNSNLLKPN
jgi:hypothetical protein